MSKINYQHKTKRARDVKEDVKDVKNPKQSAELQQYISQLKAGIDLSNHAGLKLLERLAAMRLTLTLLQNPEERHPVVLLEEAVKQLDEGNVALEEINRVMDGIVEWAGTLETRMKG